MAPNRDAFMTAAAGGVIDLMLGIPVNAADAPRKYDFLRGQLIDRESKEDFVFPAEYMFKGVPKYDEIDDPIELVLTEMDRFGIRKALLGVGNEITWQAAREHPDRFAPCVQVDPNQGMEGVRALETAVKEDGVIAATAFPAGCFPQVPINDKKFYPLYAKCVELDIPICVTAGVPGPRVPMGVQDVALIDEVCWFFPELKFVTRHGCEPWTELAVKLLLKWPNLYYSTSAFSPKHYPKDIINFANTRGAEKIMYAGYYPAGLSLDRIFEELPGVPFRDHVWPKFLRENAARVFKIDV
jgi:predicted TIM-barrel fold metal-dependent hydrolase